METCRMTADFDNAKVLFEIKLNKKPADACRLNCRISMDGEETAACEVRAGSEYIMFDVCVADADTPWQMVP